MAEAPSFKIKLRSVRFKNGGELRLLPSLRRLTSDVVGASIDKHLAAHGGDIAGYAFVVWGADMGSTVVLDVDRNPIPSALIPDFVRNCLLAYRIETWTLETLSDRER
jgi:hypothetical protein